MQSTLITFFPITCTYLPLPPFLSDYSLSTLMPLCAHLHAGVLTQVGVCRGQRLMMACLPQHFIIFLNNVSLIEPEAQCFS